VYVKQTVDIHLHSVRKQTVDIHLHSVCKTNCRHTLT